MKVFLPVSIAALACASTAQAQSTQDSATPGVSNPMETHEAMDQGVAGTNPATRAPAPRPMAPPPVKPDDPAALVKLAARLDGKSETDSRTGGGDKDAIGVFAGRLNRAEGRLCYSMKVADLEQPTAAKIVTGPAGEKGEVALTLEVPTYGEATGCVDVAREVADAMATTPENFYVNIQNSEFQNGAIRGQLSEG